MVKNKISKEDSEKIDDIKILINKIENIKGFSHNRKLTALIIVGILGSINTIGIYFGREGLISFGVGILLLSFLTILVLAPDY